MENQQSIFEIEAEIFTALAHPNRLQLLDLLRDGEQCVCHLQAALGVRQAFISQHLNVLKRAGMVASRKEGHMVYYHVIDPVIFESLALIQGFIQNQSEFSKSAQNPLSVAGSPVCNCPKCTGKTDPNLPLIREIPLA